MTPARTKSAGLTDVGFWRRFWERITGRPRLEAGEVAYPFDTYYSESGAAVNADTALKIAAVWACVRLRSETIASLPVHMKNGDKTLADGHPLFELLHLSPNADMTSSEFFAVAVASLDLWGNGYSVIDSNDRGDRVVALTPKNPEKMRVSRLVSGGLKYEYQPKGSDIITFNEDRILHFRGFTLDGLVGLSPIQYAAEMMGGVMAANQAAAREFRNSLKMGGFLKQPPNVQMSTEQRNQFRDNLATFGRPENAGKWMLLEHGFDVATANAIRMNPKDAQLLESRYQGIEDCCRPYLVPPPLIGHTDKASSWASSLENLNQYFLTYAVRPTLVRMEQTMRRKLLRPEERRGLNISFNFRGLLRGNFAQQSSAYATLLDRGVYCIDDVRDFEDEPALPDGKGKEYRVPMNTEPAGTPAGGE
jgi:HK97 family phage portal protein